jgi:hypothetical protein
MALSLPLAIIDADLAFAQPSFPAPLPGQAEAPASAAPVPLMRTAAPLAVAGASPAGGTDACMNEFLLLREEAEKISWLIKAASDRRAPAEEACQLIGDFGHAEIKMMNYIEANTARCGMPPRTAEPFRNSHRTTERIRTQVCSMAQRQPSVGPDKMLGPGDFWIDREFSHR